VVHIRGLDARETDLVLPRLSRNLYSSLVREPRPAFGSVLAPGIHYIDLEDLKQERWQAALTSLSEARAIILDMRGYPGNAVFSMLGHFVDRAIKSPLWQLPILESSEYRASSWRINPVKPRIDAKLVVLLDGRAASAAETFLQIVQENHLAIFVGETSAGTNGNANLVSLPGGFTLRFTGVRVPFANGGALQGRGIVPDVVVHPTLAGVLAGRDEILAAGIDVARKLIAN
jgi:C-terminal processing protease CtpA/Prc